MELKEFVSSVLTEIVEGVVRAREQVEDYGAEVSPNYHNTSDPPKHGFGIRTNKDAFASLVEFDVSVTVTEGAGTKGGIGIFIGPINLGSGGESRSESANISKIKFSVPLALPNDFSEYRRKEEM